MKLPGITGVCNNTCKIYFELGEELKSEVWVDSLKAPDSEESYDGASTKLLPNFEERASEYVEEFWTV